MFIHESNRFVIAGRAFKALLFKNNSPSTSRLTKSEVFDQFFKESLRNNFRPLFFVLCGEMASGKTYTSLQAANFLAKKNVPGIMVIHQDDWQLAKKERRSGRFTDVVDLDLFFTDMNLLTNNKTIYKPIFDKSRGEKVRFNSFLSNPTISGNGRRLLAMPSIANPLSISLRRSFEPNSIFVDVDSKEVIEKASPENNIFIVEGEFILINPYFCRSSNYRIFLEADLNVRRDRALERIATGQQYLGQTAEYTLSRFNHYLNEEKTITLINRSNANIFVDANERSKDIN